MRIVLDTGCFYRPAELGTLRSPRLRVVIPAVAIAERRRQLLRDRRPLDELTELLSLTGFEVEPYGRDEASSTPFLDDARWARHARDAMIAAHVRPGDVLWTTNPKDFLALGLKPEQVRAI